MYRYRYFRSREEIYGVTSTRVVTLALLVTKLLNRIRNDLGQNNGHLSRRDYRCIGGLPGNTRRRDRQRKKNETHRTDIRHAKRSSREIVRMQFIFKSRVLKSMNLAGDFQNAFVLNVFDARQQQTVRGVDSDADVVRSLVNPSKAI